MISPGGEAVAEALDGDGRRRGRCRRRRRVGLLLVDVHRALDGIVLRRRAGRRIGANLKQTYRKSLSKSALFCMNA